MINLFINIFIIIFAGFLSVATLHAADVKKAAPLIPAKAVPEKQQITTPQPSAPLKPEAMPVENIYSYNPVNKPDPFRPFLDEELAAKKKAEKKKAISIYPLQRIETEQFKLVGIGGDQKKRIAIVEDVTKKFYPLSIGTRIGLNNGKVTAILSDSVIVEEGSGKKAKRLILKLRKN